MDSESETQNSIKRYELGFLLNFLDDEHFFKQKTRKIYASYYKNRNNSQHSSGSFASGSDSSRRKSFLAETEVFSDERAIQEIRGALGKMSANNKENVITILTKNPVSESNYDNLASLLHQYATLCIEWNDLYLSVYDKVYYQSNPDFYKKVYLLSMHFIENPRHFEDSDQKMFFRVSNIELFSKMGAIYPKYREIPNLVDWTNHYNTLFYTKLTAVENEFDLDWLNMCIHFSSTIFKYVSAKEKKIFKKKWANTDWFKNINELVEQERIPIKSRFKWMDFTDLITSGSSSA